MLKKFVEFINEEYELITKMMQAAGEKRKSIKVKIPFLQDHAILALADSRHTKDTYAELFVSGNNLTLKYQENDIEKIELFNLAKFDNVTDLVEHAYNAWLKKLEDLHLETDDILIDELS
jgi:hypothetical protein